MCRLVHVDSRCGLVLISRFGHNVQLGLGYVRGQKLFFFNGCPCIGCSKILRFLLFVCRICWRLSKNGLRNCGKFDH